METKIKTKAIAQTIQFNAPPSTIYGWLMDSKKHAKVVGGKVKMSNKIKGKFEVFDGYCNGHNIELIKDKKIVQAWHFEEDGWPKDHFSICTFVFEKHPSGCKLKFRQTDIPEHKSKALKEGWKKYYWEPIKALLKNS